MVRHGLFLLSFVAPDHQKKVDRSVRHAEFCRKHIISKTDHKLTVWQHQRRSQSGQCWGALHSNTTGVANTAIGYRALNLNITGNDNTAIGFNALNNNTTGSDNTAGGARVPIAIAQPN
jgi:hypothetical protein